MDDTAGETERDRDRTDLALFIGVVDDGESGEDDRDGVRECLSDGDLDRDLERDLDLDLERDRDLLSSSTRV